MFPRFTFSDRDNIGNVFEHFKIVIRSERNRKNNATECFFAFFLTFLRQKKKMTGKKKRLDQKNTLCGKIFFPRLDQKKYFFRIKCFSGLGAEKWSHDLHNIHIYTRAGGGAIGGSN